MRWGFGEEGRGRGVGGARARVFAAVAVLELARAKPVSRVVELGAVR